MAPRSTDWRSLTGMFDDPVPGRPADVKAEADRLGKVADSIRDQVAALRKVSDPGRTTLVGQYAGTIRDTAKTLVDHLGKAEHRYRTANGALTTWAAALETAQAESAAELSRSDTAVDQLRSVEPTNQDGLPDPASPAPKNITPAQQHVLDQAHTDLAKAQSDYRATAGRLSQASAAAVAAIKSTYDGDGLHDSRWDKFKETVDNWSQAISDVCNALGWLATLCAVLALFIPGLNILAWIAFGATLLALVGHTSEALAGDGSWFDVGLDVFALITFGAGRFAGRGVKAAEESLEGTLGGSAAVRAGDRAADAVVKNANDERDLAQAVLDDKNASTLEKLAAQAKIDTIDGMNLGRMSADAKAAEIARIKDLAEHGEDFGKFDFKWPTLKAVAHGDHGAAAQREWAEDVAKELKDVDPHVMVDVTKLESSLNLAQHSFQLGAGADTIDKVFGSVAPWHTDISPWKPGWQGYYNFARNSFYSYDLWTTW
jgi:hypothetical protein